MTVQSKEETANKSKSKWVYFHMWANITGICVLLQARPMLMSRNLKGNASEVARIMSYMSAGVGALELLLNPVKDFSHKINWINGGETRQESVFNGLNSLPKDAKKVLIHDGARCLISSELIDQCAKQLDENEAVILSSRVTDTIKIVDN